MRNISIWLLGLGAIGLSLSAGYSYWKDSRLRMDSHSMNFIPPDEVHRCEELVLKSADRECFDFLVANRLEMRDPLYIVPFAEVMVRSGYSEANEELAIAYDLCAKDATCRISKPMAEELYRRYRKEETK